MDCESCTHTNSDTAKFCEECGAPLRVACGHCGTELSARAKFCPECGKPRSASSAVAAAEEGPPAAALHEPEPTPSEPTAPEPIAAPDAGRRQITVIFSDLVGSTPLSERIDAEDLREAVGAYQATCREIVEGLDGHVGQYLGDGVLVYFGYPRAHEDDAVRAVRAALRIQAEMPAVAARLAEQVPDIEAGDVQARIAVHTGSVVVGAMGGGGDAAGPQALGDTLNIAARLQELAEPGGVVISEATRRLVRGAFILSEPSDTALRGIRDPVRSYAVLRASGMGSRLDPSSAAGLRPLVGREQEVALLVDRWEAAADGQGQVVLVSAEAGMGKSRLVHALRERLAEQPHSWLEARGSAEHENTAFHPVIEALEQTLLFKPDLPAAERLDRVARALAGWGFSLEEHLPLFAELLSIPLPPDPSAPSLGPEVRRQRTLAALCAWYLALAEQQPLVLVCEDLHWLDPSTLELLGMVVEQAPTARIFLLFTFRPSFAPPWPARSHVMQLSLQPLTRRQVAALAENVAGGKRLPAELVEQIVAKTDRVPLFVEELTKTLLESDLLVERRDRWELTGPLPDVAIPSTLQDSLMARLDRLGPGKEVAQLCAILGREFSHELLEAVHPMEEGKLEGVLAGLGGAELLNKRGLPPRAVYQFKHALLQEMAYESLLRKTRQEYHARIATALEEHFAERVEAEPEVVARHYEGGGLAAKAVAAYQRAGEQAAARSANAEAIAHLTKAAEVLRTLPEDAQRDAHELELQLASARPIANTMGFGSSEAESAYRRALELSDRVDSPARRVDALLGLASLHVTRSQLDTARELAERGLSEAEGSADRDRLPLAHYQVGLAAYFQGRFAESAEHLERAAEIYVPQTHGGGRLLGDADPGVVARQWAGWALWGLGQPDRALERSRQAIALASERGEPFDLAYAKSWGAVLHLLRREYAAASELAQQAAALAEAHSFRIQLAAARLVELRARPSLAESEGPIEGAESHFGQLGQMETLAAVPQIMGELAELCLGQGRREEALRLVDGGLEASKNLSQPYWDAELHRLKGEILHRDRASEAEALMRRALEIAAKQEGRSLELRAATSLARLLSENGKATEARSVLQPVYGSFSEGFTTADLRDAAALLEGLPAA